MSIKNKVKIKTFTGSGSFDIRDEMINDSKDFLDTVEVTTIAQECVKLKTKEDEIAALEEQLKNKKAEADDISSRVIPELLAWFIAFGPYSNPRYAMSVLVEHGGSGSKAAAPLAKKLMKVVIDRHEEREKIKLNIT